MSGDTFKGGIHAVVGHLAATMCLYNLHAYQERKGRHHLLNVAVYAVLVLFEAHHTRQHWRQA